MRTRYMLLPAPCSHRGEDAATAPDAGCRLAEPPSASIPVGPIPGGLTARAVSHGSIGWRPCQLSRMAASLFDWYNCSGCHGGHAGGGMGPSLRDEVWIYGDRDDQIFNSIEQGRANGMPRVGFEAPGVANMGTDWIYKSMRTPQEPDPPVEPADEMVQDPKARCWASARRQAPRRYRRRAPAPRIEESTTAKRQRRSDRNETLPIHPVLDIYGSLARGLRGGAVDASQGSGPASARISQLVVVHDHPVSCHHGDHVGSVLAWAFARRKEERSPKDTRPWMQEAVIYGSPIESLAVPLLVSKCSVCAWSQLADRLSPFTACMDGWSFNAQDQR